MKFSAEITKKKNIKRGADSRAPHVSGRRPISRSLPPLLCPARASARLGGLAAALAPAGDSRPAAWLGGTEARAPGVRGAGQGAGRRGGARLGAAAVGVARWRRSRAGQGKARRRAGRGG